jgi:hypothetical protein
MKLLLIFAAVLLSLSPAARAQAGASQASGNGRRAAAAPSAAEVQSFAGCYELHVGRPWPWGRGVWLPRRIELLTQRGTIGIEKGHPLIRPILPKSVDSQWREFPRSPFWVARSSKRVRLVWPGPFGRDTLNLHKTRSGLSGWDHSSSDVAFSWQITHVTARRIPCTTASATN